MSGEASTNSSSGPGGSAHITRRRGTAFKHERLAGITTMTADQIERRPLDFIWKDYLVRGAVNNLVGDGGHGKGHIMADVLARLTIGADFPDGAPNTHGPVDVAIFEKEDSQTAMRLRLEKQHADLARVHFIRGPFTVTPEMLKVWLKEMREMRPRLMVAAFSPLNSYMPTRVEWGNDVQLRRTTFDPLTEFAEDEDITILTLTHPGKNPDRKAQHKVLGGVAYVNAPRITWAAVATSSQVQADGTRPPTPGRFGVIKFNDGPFGRTLAFTINDAGLHWQGSMEEDMRKLFAQSDATVRDQSEGDAQKPGVAAEVLIKTLLYPDRRQRRKLILDEALRLKVCSSATLDRVKDALVAQGFLKTDGDDWIGRWNPPTGSSVEVAYPVLAEAVR